MLGMEQTASENKVAAVSPVLILSSFVTTGHVGLSAGQPICQRLGVNVTAIPTTVLSNHPGWPDCAGMPVPPDRIDAMTDAIAANGWLGDFSAVLVGYMPSVAHVDCAARLVARLRAASDTVDVVIDPILGDLPKGLYVAEDVARAVRDRLLPLADVATPNLFELRWLTGLACDSLSQTQRAARALGVATVHVTSAPVAEGMTGVLSVCAESTRLFAVPRVPDVPHGMGDAFAAMITARIAPDKAMGSLQSLARASQGKGHLEIVAAATDWVSAPAVAQMEWE